MTIHYLVQGRAREMAYIDEVFIGRSYTKLTWDEPTEGCIFFPKSTWSEGRRRLLQEINIDSFEYIAFVDGDFSILRGGLESFERKILHFKPAIAVPVVDKNSHRYRRHLRQKQALIFDSDEQFHVIHSRVLREVFHLNPYVSRYDKLSWWYPCVQIQAFINRFLWRSSLVDLEFEISNGHECQYPNDFNAGYINNEILGRGISWYFPLTVNGKRGVFLWGRRRVDRLMILVYIYLFSWLFKPQSELHLDQDAKAISNRLFVE